MQNVCWKYVLIILILIASATQGMENEFCISTEPEILQFHQRFPALFFDHDRGFVVVWEDWRDGEYAGYAQRFDPAGTPVGKNFPLHGHQEVAMMPGGTIFSLTQKEVLEGIDYELVYEGQIQTKDGGKSLVLPIQRIYVPFCGTGFLGSSTGVMYTQNTFHAFVYYDRNLISNQYDLAGNLLNSYSFSLSFDGMNDPDARIYANGACQSQGNYVLTWYCYPKPFQINNQNVIGYYATFLNAENEIIADSVRIDSCHFHFDRNFTQTSKTVAIDSARFLFTWFDAKNAALKYQVFSDSGKSVSPVNLFDVSQYSDLPVDTTYFQFCLGPESAEKFEVGLVYQMVIEESRKRQYFLRLVIDKNGEILDAIHSEFAHGIWGKRYYTSDPQTFFAPTHSVEGNQLCKYENGSQISCVRLTDNAFGANQHNAKVIPLDKQNFLVSWRDEKNYVAQKINENGERIGDPFQVPSQSFFQLSESIFVNYRRDCLSYYSSENLQLIKTDTLSTPNQRYGAIKTILCYRMVSS